MPKKTKQPGAAAESKKKKAGKAGKATANALAQPRQELQALGLRIKTIDEDGNCMLARTASAGVPVAGVVWYCGLDAHGPGVQACSERSPTRCGEIRNGTTRCCKRP